MMQKAVTHGLKRRGDEKRCFCLSQHGTRRSPGPRARRLSRLPAFFPMRTIRMKTAGSVRCRTWASRTGHPRLLSGGREPAGMDGQDRGPSAGDDLLLLLPPDALGDEILDIPPQGAYNLHGSLLPAYRGRCPVNWVLVNGETTDRGHPASHGQEGRCRRYRRPEGRAHRTGRIPRSLCTESSVMRREISSMNSCPLMKAERRRASPRISPRGAISAAAEPEDGRIDWRWPAERIYNLIRAVTDPYPGAFCLLAGRIEADDLVGDAGRGRGRGRGRTARRRRDRRKHGFWFGRDRGEFASSMWRSGTKE